MTYFVERCTNRTLDGGKWQRIPGSERDELSEAYCTLISLRDRHDGILRIGREV